MVAYSFQPRFVEPIRAGTKGGTIRAPRRGSIATARQGGHAMPGEVLQLYCRQRHPGGFKIGDVDCRAIEPVTLRFGPGCDEVALGHGFHRRLLVTRIALNAFALFDGFANWEELGEFWWSTHQTREFGGFHIRWRELPLALLP